MTMKSKGMDKLYGFSVVVMSAMNPSDQEGEVDHSFFDSDCDDSNRNGGKKMEKGSEAERESLEAPENTGGTTNQLEAAENDKSNSAEEKENSNQLKEEDRSIASSVSSVTCTSNEVISNCSDNEEDTNPPSIRPTTALLTEAKEENQNDVPKEEASSPVVRSPSFTSTETSVDGDRMESADSQAVPESQTEDTVTDVSNLSTADCNSLRSLALNNAEAEEGNLNEQQHESVPSSGPSKVHQDKDRSDAHECSLTFESQPQSKRVFIYPGKRTRKNYSFTNDEVRDIDHENQRLHREIIRLSLGLRPGSIAGYKSVTSNSPVIRAAHSALNRQRDHHRIARENLAFLKRLQAAKPTPGLKRSEQLADYQRQAGYPRGPSYPICVSTINKGRSTSKTPTGARSVGSVHISRVVSPTIASSHTSIQKS